MDNFITWDILLSYTTFVGIAFTVVEFTKELPLINKIKTKYWSFIVCLALLIATNLAVETFVVKDILLYVLSSITISLSANGLSNFNKKGDE